MNLKIHKELRLFLDQVDVYSFSPRLEELTPRQIFESDLDKHENFGYMVHLISEDLTFYLVSLHTIWKPSDYTLEDIEQFRYSDHDPKDMDTPLGSVMS